MEVKEELAVFFEQVTPEIRKKDSFPGESFQTVIKNLQTLDNPDVKAILKVIEKLNNLRNENLIRVVGIFELDMHGEKGREK